MATGSPSCREQLKPPLPGTRLVLPQSHNQELLGGKNHFQAWAVAKTALLNRCRPALGWQEWLQTLFEPRCKCLAPQQPHAVHICLCQYRHRVLQQGNTQQCISQHLPLICNLVQLLDQDLSSRFPRWHRASRIIAELLLISAAPGQLLLHALPRHALLHQALLDSTPAPFPPYGLSSLPLPPCSGAFPMEACRERQPPSLPPLHSHSSLSGDTGCLLGWCHLEGSHQHLCYSEPEGTKLVLPRTVCIHSPLPNRIWAAPVLPSFKLDVAHF